VRRATKAADAEPHNLEAEESVLGALLAEPDRWVEAAEMVQPEEFYRAAHQTIYRHMLRLGERGTRFDRVVLKDALATAGELENVVGAVDLAQVGEGVPRSVNLAYYAGIVRGHAVRRNLLAAAAEIVTAAREAETAEQAMEQAERVVYAVRDRRTAGGGFVSAAEGLQRAWSMIQRVVDTGIPEMGLSTGLPELDGCTRGLLPGRLIIVGARPGKGKSALAAHLGRTVARVGTVGYFSLEMSAEELWTRNLAAEARIDAHLLLLGRLRDERLVPLGPALERLQPLRLEIDEEPGRTLAQVRARLRRLKSAQGLALVVIDYLQLMLTEQRGRDANRALELGEITRGLKLLARELAVPLVLLAQLNRDIEKAGAKKRPPQLSDLAETGAAEKDADQVWFVDPDDNADVCTIHVAKNRTGPKGKIKVAYFDKEFRFADISELPDRA
jgi:replicative DNA helicase